jgi:WD40 repeat protein
MSAAFSPDDSRLVTASMADSERMARQISVYDTRTWKLERQWVAHNSPVRCVAFSADGQKILSLGRDDGLRTWDAATGKRLAEVEAREFSGASRVSPDGKLLAHASAANVLTLRDTSTGKVVLRCAGHSGLPRSLAFSRDGQWLASGSEDMSAKVWNVKTGQLMHTLRGHSQVVVDVAFSPDGKRLATAARDKTTKVWDLTKPKEERAVCTHPDSIRTFTFDRDGKRLASTDGSVVKVWKADTGEVLSERSFTRGARELVFLADGSGLLVGLHSGRVVRWRFRQRVPGLIHHGEILSDLALSKDGNLLATGGKKGTLQLWETASGKLLRELKGHSMMLRSLAFSPDDRYVVSLARNVIRGMVIIHDTATGKVLRKDIVGNAPQQVAFSPDGTLLGMADTDVVRLWDIRPGQVPDLATRPRLRLYSRAKVSNGLSFSADSRRLAVTGADQAVRLWDVTTGEEILTMRPHGEQVTHVAFSPVDGLLATGGSDGKVKVWDGRPRVLGKKKQ